MAPPVTRGEHGESPTDSDNPPTQSPRARTSTRRPAPTPPVTSPPDPVIRAHSRRRRSRSPGEEIRLPSTARAPATEYTTATAHTRSRRAHPPIEVRKAENLPESEPPRRSHRRSPSPQANITVQPPSGKVHVSSPEAARSHRNESFPPLDASQAAPSFVSSQPEVRRRHFDSPPGGIQIRRHTPPSFYNAEAIPRSPDAAPRGSTPEVIQVSASFNDGRRRRRSPPPIIISQPDPRPSRSPASPVIEAPRPPPSLISSLPEVTRSPEPFIFPFPGPRRPSPPYVTVLPPETTRPPEPFVFPYPSPRPPSPPYITIHPPAAMRSPEAYIVPSQPPRPPSPPYIIPPEALRRPTSSRSPEMHIPLPPPEHRFSLPTIARRVKKLRKPTIQVTIDEDDKGSTEQEELKPVFEFIEVLPSQRRGRIKRNNRSYDDERLTTVEPLTLSFKQIQAPLPWTRREGIDGLPYYYTTKIVDGATYITEVDISTNRALNDTLAGIAALEEFIVGKSESMQPMPPNRQVYVECHGRRVAYYMVNNLFDGQCIFWLRQFNVSHNIGYPIYSTPHLRLWMLAEYWTHYEQYPHQASFSEDQVNDISGILTQLVVDKITAKPTTRFPSDDLRQLLDMMEKMGKDLHEKDRGSRIPEHDHIVAAVARVNVVLNRWRFHTLFSDKPLPTRTPLIRMLSPLLFYAPDRHLEQLQLVNPAEFIFEQSWSEFIAARERPWNDFILYATVLLAVNLSYLAVPNVVTDSNSSVGVIASLCSIISSIGCIAIGLLLVNEDRSDPKTTSESVDYLRSLESNWFGYEPLAILYSLPYALLMWSMTAFVVAVGFLCFSGSDTDQRLVTGPVALVVLVLIFWEVAVHWKPFHFTVAGRNVRL